MWEMHLSLPCTLPRSPERVTHTHTHTKRERERERERDRDRDRDRERDSPVMSLEKFLELCVLLSFRRLTLNAHHR
jgi:hypothetical protein